MTRLAKILDARDTLMLLVDSTRRLRDEREQDRIINPLEAAIYVLDSLACEDIPF